MDITLLDEGTITNLHGSMKELAEALFKFFCVQIENRREGEKHGNDRLQQTELG